MSKRPDLYLVEGRLTQEEGRLYRLRETRLRRAPAQEPCPEAGAWRELVRRLLRNPVKDK